ncbi:ribokinase [Ornithinimicrobium sp. Y1847]|uniref:ribokinase n=1 Tax=Ornithinimicrobium sp. Y1847 TaxID=3405419 RepID=UPI003B67C2C1
MTPSLVVIGSTNVDLFAQVTRHPTPGETILGSGGGRTAGGKGANQALAAGLQGAPVRFVGAVGDDGDARIALGSLEDADVDVTDVQVAEGQPTGLAIITVADDGENTIVVVPGANATVTPADARRAVEAMAQGDVLLMQGELSRTTTETAIRQAVAAGHRVILNVAPWGSLDGDVLTAADPLVLNEHEARQAVAELGLAGAHDSAGCARALREAGTPSVVVTLGPEGAVAVDADGETHVPSPRVQAVDTTGAGDAFTGALAARLLQGDNLRTAVAHAVRVGSYAVQHAGAQPSYPSLTQELP